MFSTPIKNASLFVDVALSGQLIRNFNWGPAQPSGGPQHCMYVVGGILGYQWADFQCDFEMNFLCEYQASNFILNCTIWPLFGEANPSTNSDTWLIKLNPFYFPCEQGEPASRLEEEKAAKEVDAIRRRLWTRGRGPFKLHAGGRRRRVRGAAEGETGFRPVGKS